MSLGDTWLLRNAGNTTEVWQSLEKKICFKIFNRECVKNDLPIYSDSKNLKNNFARFVSIKLIYQKKVKTCEKMLFSQNFLQNHGANEPNHPREKKKILVVMTCIGHDISKQFITGVDGSR